MDKLPAGFDLGTALRTHRKTAGLTQLDLATKAGLAERTVRGLERGSGTLESWHAALAALGLRLAGRNLPSRAARRSVSDSGRSAVVGDSRKETSPAASG